MAKLKQLVLKPQDAVVALKLALGREAGRTYATLAQELELSPSEVHKSINRCVQAGLLARVKEGRRPLHEALEPVVPALLEFLEHGLPYAFPAVRGGSSRGMPTAHAVRPLSDHLTSGNEPPPVWPSPSGGARGVAVSPLYPGVPVAAAQDAQL